MNEIHLLPLWSGVMIYKVQMFYNDLFPEIKTRLTNNFVENSFGHIKKNILQKQKKFTTNELASYLYNDVFAKYLKYYDDKRALSQFQEPMDYQGMINF